MSSTSSWFAPVTLQSAPEGSRHMIGASQKQLGFLASPIAKAARSPALLKHLLGGFPAFEQASLSLLEREVLAMTVAYEVGCHYCMAMHSALGSRAPDVAPHVGALREGRPLADRKLEALRVFVRELVRTHAHPAPEVLEAFATAGYTEENALDVVLGVGVYLLSTYSNVITGSELDAPFAAFAWSK